VNLRRAARKDRNHGEIVRALRAAGCVVADVSGTACGCDVFVYAPRLDQTIAVEIKDGSKPPSARAMTPTELEMQRTWTSAGGRYEVVLSVVDALEVVGLGPVI
jgi:hypothetical protein